MCPDGPDLPPKTHVAKPLQLRSEAQNPSSQLIRAFLQVISQI